MKSLILFVVFSASLLADTCSVASLSMYETKSCSIDGITFSDFKFIDNNGLLSADSILVSPLTSGLQFDVGIVNSTDATISYVETGSGFLSDTLAILGFGQSGSGSLDVGESICVNAVNLPNGVCPTQTLSLNVFDNFNGIKQSDTVILPNGTTTLGIVKDLGVTAPANLSLVDNTTPVSGVPEPKSGWVVGIGIAMLMISSSRYRATRSR